MARAGGYATYWAVVRRLATDGLRSLRSAVASELPAGWHDVEVTRVWSTGNVTTVVFRGRAGRTYAHNIDWRTDAGKGQAAALRRAANIRTLAPTELVGARCKIELRPSRGPVAYQNSSGETVVMQNQELQGVYSNLAEARNDYEQDITKDLELRGIR